MATAKNTAASKAPEQATAEQKNEVAIKQEHAIVPASFMDDDMGQGFEGADAESYAIPFLQILQKMSPAVDEDNGAYVEGAKQGMLLNSVTNALYDVKERPLQIIPCAFKRTFIHWGPRGGAEGGFKGEITPEEMDEVIAGGTVENVSGKYLVKDEKGNVDPKKSAYYADTRSHYVIVIDPETGEYGPAILALSSTQTKASRGLMTALNQRKVDTPRGKRTPPSFANIVNMTTQTMSNDQGTWAVAKFEIQKELIKDADLYAAAKEFYRTVSAGEANADYSKVQENVDEGANSEPKEADGF